MSTKRKPAKIVDAAENEDGSVRLTFTRPHGALGPGAVIVLHNGPHRVIRIHNKFMVTVEKMEVPAPAPPPDPPLRTRARLALRVLIGNRRPKARA